MLKAAIASLTYSLLTISYAITNDRNTVVYVLDGLFTSDRQGNRAIDPFLGYTIHEKEGKIVIGKFLVAIPPGMKVEAPEIPYLQKLDPGRTLNGMLHLQLPLLMNHPYLESRETDIEEKVKTIVLRMGIIDSAEIRDDEAVIEPAKGIGTGKFICDYGLGLERQELFEVVLNVENQKIIFSVSE